MTLRIGMPAVGWPLRHHLLSGTSLFGGLRPQMKCLARLARLIKLPRFKPSLPPP